MVPFFFGDTQCPLYGVSHPAQGDKRRSENILLCCPLGQEYMRSHRAFRQIAMLLARQGFHVLRFDYRGTGDAGGDMEDVSAGQWLEDIDTAISELRETSGHETTSIIGLRLGALLATEICKRREDIDRLVVWDPILSGSAYEQELTYALENKPVEDDLDNDNFIDEQGTMYFNGFPLTKVFREGLNTFDMIRGDVNVEKILQIVSHENDNFQQIKQFWQLRAQYNYLHAPSPGDWNYVDDFGGILLPQPVIQAIVNWFD